MIKYIVLACAVLVSAKGQMLGSMGSMGSMGATNGGMAAMGGMRRNCRPGFDGTAYVLTNCFRINLMGMTLKGVCEMAIMNSGGRPTDQLADLMSTAVNYLQTQYRGDLTKLVGTDRNWACLASQHPGRGMSNFISDYYDTAVEALVQPANPMDHCRPACNERGINMNTLGNNMRLMNSMMGANRPRTNAAATAAQPQRPGSAPATSNTNLAQRPSAPATQAAGGAGQAASSPSMATNPAMALFSQMSGMSMPGMSLPGMSMPGFSMPGMSLPGMSMPGMSMPGLSMPGGMSMPGLAQMFGMGGGSPQASAPTNPFQAMFGGNTPTAVAPAPKPQTPVNPFASMMSSMMGQVSPFNFQQQQQQQAASTAQQQQQQQQQTQQQQPTNTAQQTPAQAPTQNQTPTQQTQQQVQTPSFSNPFGGMATGLASALASNPFAGASAAGQPSSPQSSLMNMYQLAKVFGPDGTLQDPPERPAMGMSPMMGGMRPQRNTNLFSLFG